MVHNISILFLLDHNSHWLKVGYRGCSSEQCRLFTHYSQGSQISLLRFLEQRAASIPYSQPFWDSEIYPLLLHRVLHKEQPPCTWGSLCSHFGNAFWAAERGRGERWKSEAPTKQLMCHILVRISHQQPETLLTETLNNRLVLISFSKWEFSRHKKIRGGMAKCFCLQVSNSDKWMYVLTHQNRSSRFCCESSPWGCSSQQFSQQRCGTTSCLADCSMWWHRQISSQQPQQSMMLLEGKERRIKDWPKDPTVLPYQSISYT